MLRLLLTILLVSEFFPTYASAQEWTVPDVDALPMD